MQDLKKRVEEIIYSCTRTHYSACIEDVPKEKAIKDILELITDQNTKLVEALKGFLDGCEVSDHGRTFAIKKFKGDDVYFKAYNILKELNKD